MVSNDITVVENIIFVLSLGLNLATISLTPILLHSILDNKLQLHQNLGLNSCENIKN